MSDEGFAWKCSKCGTVNGIHRDSCDTCGNNIYKSQAAEQATPPAVRPTHCENCNGTGTVFSQAFTPRKCEDCHGKGIAVRPTPETDEILRRNAESDQTPEEDYEALADHTANLEYRLAERTEQRDTLQRWKDEALTVESWWQKIDDAIRAHPDAIIGHVVADTALRFIRERDVFATLLRDANDHVHECPLKARVRMALSATKGGQS